MKNQKAMNAQNNAFPAMLGTLRKGLTASELSDELTNLVGLVRETGKKGALTIKFQIDGLAGEVKEETGLQPLFGTK